MTQKDGLVSEKVRLKCACVWLLPHTCVLSRASTVAMWLEASSRSEQDMQVG